jgi:polar amino acid transport system substrate-binding protein
MPRMRDPTHAAVFAPGGTLRAAINLGNTLLARKVAGSGQPYGVSVDIAAAFADWLDVPVDYILFDTAAESLSAVAGGRADIGFFADDPLRRDEIEFSAPYLFIEGSYLVRDDSAIRRNEEVDRVGQTVVVGRRSAYDLYLSRELKHAHIVRAPTSQLVVDVFVEQRADVAAGVRQQLETDARRVPGLRLLDGRFMVIRQALGIAKARGPAAAAALRGFVEALKREGFVQQSLAEHRIEGTTVAPMADGALAGRP